MAMVYKWKPHANFSIAAQVAGEELERIRSSKNGNLIANDVVQAAKEKSSPLHLAFEWDDKKAAHFYRLDRAGELVRSVVVLSINKDGQKEPIRAFVNVGEGDNRGYTSIAVAMADEVMRAQVLSRAWKELEDWRKRYDQLAEFREVFHLIDSARALQAA